jgi:hypothetical protein
MSDDIRYEIWTGTPDLESFRLEYSPRDGLETCGYWPCVALRGESGNYYWVMLTVNESTLPIAQVSDASVIHEPGFRQHSSPLIVPDMEIRRFRRFEFEDHGDNLEYRFKWGGHCKIWPDKYEWWDLNGAVDLKIQQLGDAVYFRIPLQERIKFPIYHQSQTGVVSGNINGDPVFGLSLLDVVWTRPNKSWYDSECLRYIEQNWTMWLVEYEDGTYDGGYAWNGKEGWKFDAGHLIQNNVSTACQTARSTVTSHEIGLPERIDIDYGGHYQVQCDFTHQADWPMHLVGKVSATSAGKKIKDSMVVTEWIPYNMDDILDGKIPGLNKYPDLHKFKSTIVNQRIVPA